MKKFIKILLIIIILSLGIYFNNKNIKIKSYNIKCPKISQSFNNFKILHFSDTLLTKKSINKIDNVVEKINATNPDVVIFTGDLIKKDFKLTSKEEEHIINALSQIKCKLYKYAIIGDNDKKNINQYTRILDKSNFEIIDDEYKYLFYKDKNPIKIIGLTNYKNFNIIIEDEDNIKPCYTILLTHKPDIINDININNINTILAGHSLGGEINVPFMGGLIKKEGATKYINNYYKIKGKNLYISNGIGTEKLPFRIFNQPSINEYIIEK